MVNQAERQAPSPLSPGRRVVVTYPLIDAQKIRDTAPHWADRMLDLRRAENWGFEVENHTDQSVAVHLIASGRENPSSAGDVGVSVNVAAGTTEPMVTSYWMPWLGLRIIFAIAPTTGSISIEGFVQEVF